MLGIVNDDSIGDDLPEQKAAEKKAKKEKKKLKKEKEKEKEKEKKSKKKHKKKDGAGDEKQDGEAVHIHMGNLRSTSPSPGIPSVRSSSPGATMTTYSGVGIVTGDDVAHFNVRAASPSLNRISDPVRSESRSRGIRTEREMRESESHVRSPSMGAAGAGVGAGAGLDQIGNTLLDPATLIHPSLVSIHSSARHHSISQHGGDVPAFHAQTHRTSLPPVDTVIPGPRQIVLIDNTSRTSVSTSQTIASQQQQQQQHPQRASFDGIMTHPSHAKHTPNSAPTAPTTAIELSLLNDDLSFNDLTMEEKHHRSSIDPVMSTSPTSSPQITSTLPHVSLDMPKIQTRLETWHDLKQAAKRRIWLTRILLMLDMCCAVAMIGIAASWSSYHFASDLVFIGQILSGVGILIWAVIDLIIIGKLPPRWVFGTFLTSIALSIWIAIVAAVAASTDRDTIESRTMSTWLSWNDQQQASNGGTLDGLVNREVQDIKNSTVIQFVTLPIMVFTVFLHLRLHNMITRHTAVVKAQTADKAKSRAAMEKRAKQIERYKQKQLYGESDVEDRQAIAKKHHKKSNTKQKKKSKKGDQFTDLGLQNNNHVAS